MPLNKEKETKPFNEKLGEKAAWEWHKDAECYFE